MMAIQTKRHKGIGLGEIWVATNDDVPGPYGVGGSEAEAVADLGDARLFWVDALADRIIDGIQREALTFPRFPF